VFFTETGRGPRAEEALMMGNEELYEVEEMVLPPRVEGLPPEAERFAVVCELPPGRRGGVGAGRDGVRDEMLLYAMVVGRRD